MNDRILGGSRDLSAVLAVLALALLTVLAAAPAGASDAPETSQVYIVHGVPGGAVDVRLDGELVREGLESKGVLGPLEVEPGRHRVAFRTDDWSIESAVDVMRASEDIVVHEQADPNSPPAVTVFANRVGPVREGHGRLTIAHTAVVPPADVRANGKVLFANIANGEFVTTTVPENTYAVDVVPTGGDDPLLGPVDLEVEAAALTRVFAIGTPTGGSMDAIVQVLPLPERAVAPPPAVVRAGETGAVAPSVDASPGQSSGLVTFGIALASALGVAGVTAVWLRRRRHVAP